VNGPPFDSAAGASFVLIQTYSLARDGGRGGRVWVWPPTFHRKSHDFGLFLSIVHDFGSFSL